jgi:hypothetical protein
MHSQSGAGWRAVFLWSLLALALLPSGNASAQVTYGADALSRLFLISSDTMGVTVMFGVTGLVSDKIGFADVTGSGSQTTGPTTLSSSVSGFADAPGFSSSDGVYLNGAIIRLENTDVNPRLATFRLEMEWTLSALTVNPLIGFSGANAFFNVTGIDDEVLLVDGIVAAEYLLEPGVNSAMMLPPIMGEETVSLGVLVAPESTAVFSLITDASGFGFVAAPEPASLLFLVAVAPIILRRRKHRLRRGPV